jgi:hypothetical protein
MCSQFPVKHERFSCLVQICFESVPLLAALMGDLNTHIDFADFRPQFLGTRIVDVISEGFMSIKRSILSLLVMFVILDIWMMLMLGDGSLNGSIFYSAA